MSEAAHVVSRRAKRLDRPVARVTLRCGHRHAEYVHASDPRCLSVGRSARLAGSRSGKIHLKVAGNLLATGLIQQKKEQPFFENLAKTTGLPVEVDYKPMDMTGIKDIEGLRVLKSGLFDIVTLRIAQVSRDEPFFLGLDLVGLNPDYETTRKVVDAYREPFDKRLQERFNAKLLGLWPFGPQVLFCKVPINGLTDLKNKKVRVYDQSLAKFIETLGGIPVTLSFGETQQALAKGVTDCAITGPSSANSAGWPEVSTHTMPIGFQVAVQAYGINLDTWKKFSPSSRRSSRRPSPISRRTSGPIPRSSGTTPCAAMPARTRARR